MTGTLRICVCLCTLLRVYAVPQFPDTVTDRYELLYPYGVRAGDLEAPPISEDFWLFDLEVDLQIFGARYQNVSISDNSIVNFGDYQFGQYDNQVYIPRSEAPPMVYGLWTDWDFTDYGQIYARQETDDARLLARVSGDVEEGLASNVGADTPHGITFSANYLLIVTYFNGSEYLSEPVDNKFNTLQFVFATDGRRTFVIINYAHMEWYQVGQYARAGYDVGDGFNHYDHPFSGTPEIRNIDDYSNVNVDGRMMFQINMLCDPGVCSHDHGVCIENGLCLCEDGYTGSLCSEEIDECQAQPCLHGNCTDLIDDFHCDCEVGFLGKLCDDDIDFCETSPCQHGTCEDLDPTYRCHCWPGYTGVDCEYEINECASCPCISGYCEDHLNNFTCVCDVGFRGERCTENIDECEDNACEHGTCVDGIDDYMCFCHPGYNGTFCDNELDECDPDPCVQGTCEDEVDDFHCICPPGFTGRTCEVDVDECEAHPCSHGICFQGVNSFRCSCETGYTGVLCEENINDCDDSLCRPHGVCRDAVFGFICECHRGFTGRMCDVNIDECSSSPCDHGTCQDEDNGYYCQCFDGFKGIHCDVDVDECSSSPCLHGSCDDEINGYTCTCEAGFTGRHCQTNINECEDEPCDHGYCLDRVNGFKCVCFPGYTGVHCEDNINECHSSPCINGNCIDIVNSFACDCPDSVHGERCHLDDRPRVGAWGPWSDWTECSKPCDSGLQTRLRQCLHNPCYEPNTQSQLCNVVRCHGDPTEPSRFAVTLETSKSQAEVAEDEHVLKSVVAESLNQYCTEHRAVCCRLVNITTPTVLNPFQVFNSGNLGILSGYPMMVNKKVVRVKVLMTTTVGEMRTACVQRVRRAISLVTDSQLVYVPPSVLQAAIQQYREHINEATCCWSLTSIVADHTVSYILMGVLIPVGVLLLVLCVVCLVSPNNCCPTAPRDDTMLTDRLHKSPPALMYYPMYTGNRQRPRYDGYPMDRRF